MLAAFRQRRYRAAFAWLALAAVLLRGLLPTGFMPAHAGGEAPGIVIAWCSGGTLHFDGHDPAGHRVESGQCPFALSAMAAIPPSLPALRASERRASGSASEAVPAKPAASFRALPPARAPPAYS